MIRLGAMGDIIHAMPAALSLQSMQPGTEVHWAVERRWLPLLDGCPEWTPVVIDRSAILQSVKRLRKVRYNLVVDCQGLLKSALLARTAHANRVAGYAGSQCREPLASWFYSERFSSPSTHIAERHLDLAQAAGAKRRDVRFPLPEGSAEGDLPEGRYVLANPLAGWRAKQWPLDRYAPLAKRLRDELDLAFVVNVAPGTSVDLPYMPVHVSGLRGLIHATRRAAAVVGLDSGPMHLAAALGIPGVALFGPTDPARNGPVGGSFTVLRDPLAATSYKRRDEWDASLLALSVDQVFEALLARLRGKT